MTSRAFRRRINSKRFWGWCRANEALERNAALAGSRRRGIRACDICWSKRAGEFFAQEGEGDRTAETVQERGHFFSEGNYDG